MTQWDINGIYRYSLLLKMAIEIVDLPSNNGDFPSFFVCLPGGSHYYPFLP